MLLKAFNKQNIFIVSVLLIMKILLPTVSFANADRIFKDNNKAVVVVIAYDKEGKPISQGSGFIVKENGAIVTNYHVINNATDIKVKAGDNFLEFMGLLHTDKENDVVILKVKGKSLPAVKIGDMTKMSVGDKVYVISSPQGLENTISDGILSGIREITSQRKVLQITAPISKGSSGGPVFNKDGQVIGIATFLIKDAQNLNFAMPVNFIRDKINNEKITALNDIALEDYRETSDYWIVLGISYFETKMYKEAIEAYEHAIKINPTFARAYRGLGFIYSELKMYKEAIETINKAIRLEPGDADTYFTLGFIYGKTNMFSKAAETFKQAIRIKPDHVAAHSRLGLIYDILGMSKEAIESYKQAIRLRPDYVEAHFGLGLAYLGSGNKGKALDQYKILKELDSEKAEALFNLIYSK